MEILLLLVAGAMNVACFLIGAKVGQMVVKGERIELPTVNPLEIARKKEAIREADRAKDRMDTILRNIDKYDGTATGQEDVPNER